MELCLEATMEALEAMRIALSGLPLRAILITFVSAAISGTIGITLVVWARDITQFYRNHYKSHRYLRLLFPLGQARVESAYYETNLRVVGALMLGVAALLLFVMVRGLLSGHS